MPTIRKRAGRFNVQVRIKEGGQIVHQESATFDTRPQAEAWGQRVESRIKSTGWKARQSATITVYDLMLAYEKSRPESNPWGKGMQHSIDAVLKSPLTEARLGSLSADKVVAWGMSLIKDRLAPATVMHHLSALRAAWNAAPALLGLSLDGDPVGDALTQLRKVRVAAPSVRRDRRVSDEELDAICAAVEGNEVPTSTYVRLAVAFPRRREELLTMEWRHMAADGSHIKLVDTKSPNGYREEVVPIPPDALEIIKALPRTDRRILPYKPESVSAAFQRAVRRIGLLDIRLHDLRHEGISRLFEQELSIQEVALISGHTSWSTLRRYTHIRPQTVVEKLNARRQRKAEAADEPPQP